MNGRTWILETSTRGKDGLIEDTTGGEGVERKRKEKEKGPAEGWAAKVEPYGCEVGMERLQLEPQSVRGLPPPKEVARATDDGSSSPGSLTRDPEREA